MSGLGSAAWPSFSWSTGLRWIGLVVSLICCTWVGWVLWSDVAGNAGVTDAKALVLPMAAGGLATILINACMGIAWQRLVVMQGERLRVSDAIMLFWRVQIAKYIPGNVFHLAGRVMLAKQLGVSRGVAIRAIVMESALLVILVGLICLRWIQEWTGPGWWWWLLAAGLVMIWPAIRWGRTRFSALAAWRLDPGTAILILCSFLAIFLLQALVFAFFLPAVGGGLDRTFWQYLEMVTFSWGAGFVVVGAPGGLGVREAVLVAFAHTPVEAHQLLLVGALTRLSSVGGDAVSLVLGGVLWRKGQAAKLASSSSPK